MSLYFNRGMILNCKRFFLALKDDPFSFPYIKGYKNLLFLYTFKIRSDTFEKDIDKEYCSYLYNIHIHIKATVLEFRAYKVLKKSMMRSKYLREETT